MTIIREYFNIDNDKKNYKLLSIDFRYHAIVIKDKWSSKTDA